MPSQIAWLDASSEEQRKMRDIIQLFTERESRDELGIGQLRSAISDGLFPGTTVLLTRARYMLFVPWIYQLASTRADPEAEADRLERKLIAAMDQSSEDTAGLLGAVAGSALKNLPSAIYWGMLRRYRVVLEPAVTRSDAVRMYRAGHDAPLDKETLRPQIWSTTMPGPPPGFPHEIPGGFTMTPDEAAWLRDRILNEAPGTLLAHLAVNPPSDTSDYAWLDEAALRVTGGARALLDHAQAFSAVLHGAQLLYNYLLAESSQRVARQPTSEATGADNDPVEEYRDRLDVWAAELETHLSLATWDLEDLITRAESIRESPLHGKMKSFIREWLSILREDGQEALFQNGRARRLITLREKCNKKSLARIDNPKRLQTWSGASGAGALNYRWGTVRTIMADIRNGLSRESEVARA
ncbi:MAG: hypothetical protein KDB25_02785 [Leucobacter sp.]|nr:hypothetical protein [Leucobacter sp.]